MVTLPITQRSAQFRFACELDGVTYVLGFRYNDRDGIWRLDIGDANNTPLALGLALVTNMPLLRAVRTLPGLPPGELMVIDTASGDTDPTFDSIGRRHLVMYATLAEVIALGG